MSDENVWYLGKRAEQLAFVYLSRREDVMITEQSQSSDYGVDYLVTLINNGEYTGRMFGVEVKALKSTTQVQRIAPDGSEAQINIKNVFVPKDIPFPLCLFVFIMETDEGYFRWLKKPVYDGQSHPLLRLNQSKLFRRLSSKTLDDVIIEVNNWYDSKMKIPA